MIHLSDRTLTPAAFVLLAMACLPSTASAQPFAEPDVPINIAVPVGHRLLLVGRAAGTQNYICLPSAAGVAWTLFGPQATLFDDHDRQTFTHFLSLNPEEPGTLRATWQHSRTTTAVWGQAIQTSSDAAYVAPGAIPWLLLRVVGAAEGQPGDPRYAQVTFIQRLNTSGGQAPVTGCAGASDVGTRAFVPYAADYYFWFPGRTIGSAR